MFWNKDYTKLTHPILLQTSQTMKLKKIDNLLLWRGQMKELGLIPQNYLPLKPSLNLAKWIEYKLGNGNISESPRSERLIAIGNANNLNFINYYAFLRKEIFNKKPLINKVFGANAIRFRLYQKKISQET